MTLVSKSGMRVGPTKLVGASSPVPANTYSSASELLQYLRDRRASDTGESRIASIVLPDYIARSDVVRLEVTRVFQPFTYKLDLPLPSGNFFFLRDRTKQERINL